MYVRNRSKKRKYLIVKLFGTRSCDGSLYVCCCMYNGCINRRDVHITKLFTKNTSTVEIPSKISIPQKITQKGINKKQMQIMAEICQNRPAGRNRFFEHLLLLKSKSVELTKVS